MFVRSYGWGFLPECSLLLRMSFYLHQLLVYYAVSPNTKEWWIVRVWRRMCVLRHTICGRIKMLRAERWYVSSSVTNIQLEELTGFLINWSNSIRSKEHAGVKLQRHGLKFTGSLGMKQILTDNYFPQQGISASAQAYLKPSIEYWSVMDHHMCSFFCLTLNHLQLCYHHHFQDYLLHRCTSHDQNLDLSTCEGESFQNDGDFLLC